MLYRTNGEAIRPLHEWTKTFERLWSHQLMRIKERAEEKTNEVDRQVGSESEPASSLKAATRRSKSCFKNLIDHKISGGWNEHDFDNAGN